MVEINNQRKAFLDMPAWSEGTDNGRQKTRNHWLWRHCRRRAIYWLWSPRKLVTLNPKLEINRRRTLPASFRWWDAYLGVAWRLLSKSGRCGILCRLRGERRFMIDRGDIRRTLTVAAISGLHCRALVMVSSSIRLTADFKIQRSGRNGQRDWCMSRVTAIISALVICIIVCLSWAVNHYRDNAITYKAQRDKNAREN